jgi:flavin-dependent dehydrogenase
MELLKLTGFSTDLKPRGYPIPAGGMDRKIGGDRILLAGDAAGFVDSCNGEGIGYAIRSGQLAAESIRLGLPYKNASSRTLMSYVSGCKNEIGDNLKYSLYLSRFMHRYPGVFLKLMGSNSDLVDKYLEVPARRRSYRQFFAWMLPRIPYFLYTSTQKPGQ